jgi:hypothetical protein
LRNVFTACDALEQSECAVEHPSIVATSDDEKRLTA